MCDYVLWLKFYGIGEVAIIMQNFNLDREVNKSLTQQIQPSEVRSKCKCHY